MPGSATHATCFERRFGIEQLMATATEAIQSPPTGSRYQKLRCGVRGANGLSDDQVKEHQRTRLYEAMVEIAAIRGYQATTIKAMCGLAGVVWPVHSSV